MRKCSKWLESNEKEVYTSAALLEIKSDLRTATQKRESKTAANFTQSLA